MASKHNYYNDWVLPVVTTFLGVFAAAYLTIWWEDRNEDESVRMLLEVAQTDSCLALASSQRATSSFAAQADRGVDGFLAVDATIVEPKIMLAVLEDNAKSLADFHTGLTAEMVGLLATIEVDIVEYRQAVEQLQQFARIMPFIDVESGSSESVLRSERERMLADTRDRANGIEASLRRMAFLLDQQLGLIRGELTQREVGQHLSASDFKTPCAKVIK